MGFVNTSGWFGVYCLIVSVCGLAGVWCDGRSWLDCGVVL